MLTDPEVTPSSASSATTEQAGAPDANGATAPPRDGDANAPATRVCGQCSATMGADQDWCLECGTAAPGRLGVKPGVRAIFTVVACTLLLAVTAVAASYAALSEDAKVEAGQPGTTDATPVAQAPPVLPPASVPPASATPPVTPAAPLTPATKLPKVTLPSTAGVNSAPPVPSVSIPIAPAPSSNSNGTGTGSNGDDLTTPEEDDTAATTPAVKSIELPADAIAIYDPYKRATSKGDTADAQDGDRDSSLRIATPDDDRPMGLGIVVDLEKTTAVRAVELLTDTPGYRIEVYGTTSSELPPDILDARWEHFADRSKVDQKRSARKTDRNVAGDDKERIALGGTRKLRYLNLWLTTAPTKGPLVRIAELDLFG